LSAKRCQHSWASASRPMPPASKFRHPASQCDSGVFRYQTGPRIQVPDWFRNIHYFIFWYRANQMLDSSSSASKRTVERRKDICRHVHVCTSDGGKGTPCMSLFLGPKWHSPIGSMPFHRAQKTLEFRGPTRVVNVITTPRNYA
jgi:hypothetical protein